MFPRSKTTREALVTLTNGELYACTLPNPGVSPKLLNASRDEGTFAYVIPQGPLLAQLFRSYASG
jgi:hypothetical protein